MGTNSILINEDNLILNKGKDFLNKTYYPKAEDANNNIKSWYIIDANGQILGRLASLAATIIRGKLNPQYHPAVNMGNNVIVINADKVKVTGQKYKKNIILDTHKIRVLVLVGSDV